MVVFVSCVTHLPLLVTKESSCPSHVGTTLASPCMVALLTPVCMRALLLLFIYSFTRIHLCIYIPTYIHTYIDIYAYSYTYIHTYIHSYTPFMQHLLTRALLYSLYVCNYASGEHKGKRLTPGSPFEAVGAYAKGMYVKK